MRIAHVLSSFGMGGQEKVALDLAIGQRQAGHSVIAVSLAPKPDGPLAADFVAIGATIATVPKRDGFDALLPFKLARLFRAERVNIVHTHNPQPLVYGALGGVLAGARAVHTKHGANPDRPRRVMMRRAAALLVSAFVAVSETTAEVARQNDEVALRKLSVIPNGVDLSRFHPDAAARIEVRKELAIPQEAFVIGTVGRLAPEKNQTLLLRAAASLLSSQVHLVIVGDGGEAERLRQAAADQAAASPFIHLSGARRDVPRLLATFDTFVLSSRTEGLPLVIPEAMATALPVISTAVGGIPTVVEEGVTGYLVPPGDEAALRARIGELVRDPPLARRLGEAGRRIALERYSSERMVRDYLAVYERVLST